MARFIKQSDFDALQAKSDEIKRIHGIKSLKDEIEYAISQPNFPMVEKLLIVPDDQWGEQHEESVLDWDSAMKLLRDGGQRGF